MRDLNYSLQSQQYTWKNALCWGNFVGHCQKAASGSLGNRVVHILIAIAEFFPLISQISSIFEKLIVEYSQPHEESQALSKRHISIETQHAFAQKIQRLFKGHCARIKYKKLQKQAIERKAKIKREAAQKILNIYTSHRTRIEFKKWQIQAKEKTAQIQREAAQKIQCLYKGHRARIEFKKAKEKASACPATVKEALDSATRFSSMFDKSFKNILQHKKFPLNEFTEEALKSDTGQPRLFQFTSNAAADLFEISSKMNKPLDPFAIKDPISKQNFFEHAVQARKYTVLNALSELNPKIFQTLKPDFFRNALLKNDSVCYLWKKYCEAGCKLDSYLEMACRIASNESIEKYEKEFSLFTAAQQKDLYQLAYDYKNAHVQEPSKVPVKPDEYTINFMWINSEPMPGTQEYLFGEGKTQKERDEDFTKKFVMPISSWAKANPGTSITIWYDGYMVKDRALLNSVDILKRHLDATSFSKVTFQDVRTIDLVKENQTVFGFDIPVFFRVDLLKAITADHVLRKEKSKYYVFCDLDVEALPREKLFDQRSIDSLKDLGFLMSKGGFLLFENGFQIWNKEHVKMRQSHRQVVIDLNIEMAKELPHKINEQQVYDCYIPMLIHYLHGEGRYGKFVKPVGKKLEEDDDEEDLTFDTLKAYRFDNYRETIGRHVKRFEKSKAIDFRNVIPKKPVVVPPSHFGLLCS